MIRRHKHLHEVLAGLRERPAGSIIYAERIGGKFRPESVAVVLELTEREIGRPIREVAAERAPGLECFLEVFVALAILERLRSKGTDLGAMVDRVIYYVEHDA